MRRLAFVLCIGIAPLLLTSCWEGISRHVLATVLAVRGDATIRPNEAGSFQPVTNDSVFGGGATIRTATGGEVDLMPVPGIYVRLFGKSELTIEELTLVKDGNETAGGMISRTARLRLNRGRAVFHFEAAEAEVRGQLIVQTAGTTFSGNPGTLFGVETNDQTTRLVCALGTVYPSGADRTGLAIQQGFFQVWPSEHRDPLAAAEDTTAQAELADALKAGQELQNEREENLPRANRFPR